MGTRTGWWRGAAALVLAALIVLVALAAPGGEPRGGVVAAAPAKPTRTPRATTTPKPTTAPKPTKTPTAPPTPVPPTATPPTATSVPTDTPMPTAASCVPTTVLRPTGGDKAAGTITLSATQSIDPCGHGLRYLWTCNSPDDPNQCDAMNAATSNGDVTTYPLTLAEGQRFSIDLQVCTLSAEVLCGEVVSEVYLGVMPS